MINIKNIIGENAMCTILWIALATAWVATAWVAWTAVLVTSVLDSSDIVKESQITTEKIKETVHDNENVKGAEASISENMQN